MDQRSILGYSKGSPYINEPAININTPEGYIDMVNTRMDLLGIDEFGNAKVMKAGRKKNYKFEGQNVLEIPLLPSTQMQRGGFTSKQMFDFLFDDEDEAPKQSVPTAPTVDDVDVEMEARQRQQLVDEAYMNGVNEAMMMSDATTFSQKRNREDGLRPNPFVTNGSPLPTLERPQRQPGVNPYIAQQKDEILEKYGLSNLGIWGDKSHQSRKSDHNTGDAIDFGVNGKPEQAEAAIAELQSSAKQKNVKYIIYNGKIWNPSVSQDWRPYNGPNPHKGHFHVSYNR